MADAEGAPGLFETFPRVLEPKRRIAAYATVFRDVDGDFFFRHHRGCRIYATLKRPEGVVKSEPILISVNSRSRRKFEDELIKKEYRALREALLTEEVYLFGPQGDTYGDRRTEGERLANLVKIRDALDAGSLKETLQWRIELLRFKYGGELDRPGALKRLEKIRPTLQEPSRDLLSLLLTTIHVEQGNLEAARKELDRVADDSPQKRQIEFTIADKEKKMR